MNPTRKSGLPWRVIDGRAVVIAPAQGEVHELNPAGAFLWTAADGSKTLETIAESVAENFEVSPDASLADAREFYGELARHGLVSWES